MSVAVRFEDVSVSFSGRMAVSSASFTIPAGKRTATLTLSLRERRGDRGGTRRR